MAMVIHAIPNPVVQPMNIIQPPPAPVVQPINIIQPPPAPVVQPVNIIQPAPAPVVQPVNLVQSPPAAVTQAPEPVVVQFPIKAIPAPTKCSYCKQQVVTMVRPVNGNITWVVAGTLFFCGIWPFCVIPFFLKSCKDVEHTCPNCKNVIALYKRM